MKILSLRASIASEPWSSCNNLSSAIYGVKWHRLFEAVPSYMPKSLQLSICCAVRFRPCIDIHKAGLLLALLIGDGKVKQIVGSTLRDSKEGSSTIVTNFESDKSASEFAKLYKEDGLTGGHVIMLGADPLSKSAAVDALHAYPGEKWKTVSDCSLLGSNPLKNEVEAGGLQVGGGINLDNAMSYIEEGASHVIVTSYVFNNGQMDLDRLKDLVQIVGRQRLVLDLSCRKKEGKYAIVTDRWQKFSDVYLDEATLDFLGVHADEFLVHGVDVEGKKLGIDEELVALLGRLSPIPVTYAGGVSVMADLERIKEAGMGRVDVTVGSALDIFGGNLAYKDIVAWHVQQKKEALTV
ncbi:Histidine biosynthesis protein [Dillenia turbinata]|uniref:1-(5-phosphoribosyl)-5-[(5-phosphoribosylamino)methylideneamino] imidazole-4-carboxamide isomerase HISN3, chloroplastic n=1 Tax=Dillenia turbinata TaxID=194707 RepID=A0AAN8ZJT8_9MAGN